MREHFRRLPFWRKAEKAIAQRLRLEGIPSRLVAAQNLPWDIVTVSGLRVECKAAKLLRGRKQWRRIRKNGKPKEQSPFWYISIARHRRLNEDGVDFYVCYLTGCHDVRPVYLVLKAPLKKKTLQISLRQLLIQWTGKVNAFHLIREAA